LEKKSPRVINFSGISNAALVGRALRVPLRLIPKQAEVRILQGPLRGKRWIAGSSNHGCWLGSYELAKVKRVASMTKPGMVCFDVGAHVGYYTLLFSALVGSEGLAVAFEPLAENCQILEHHAKVNSCKNVVIMQLAASDTDGPGRFAEHESTSMGRLSDEGSTAVTCARIDTLVSRQLLRPADVMKIDVEGAELAVLKGSQELLRRHKPVVFLTTHGSAVDRECCLYLKVNDYQVVPLYSQEASDSRELLATAY
jgi:FkbM family methyltransferase